MNYIINFIRLHNVYVPYVQVIYDGNGNVIHWIMVTDGSVISDDFTISGNFDVMFLKSETGGLNATVVRNTMISIQR